MISRIKQNFDNSYYRYTLLYIAIVVTGIFLSLLLQGK